MKFDTRFRAALVVVAAIAAAGCSAPATAPGSTPTSAVSSQPAVASQPAKVADEPQVEVVTRTALTDEARTVLEVCGMLDAMDSVTSLIHLESLADAARFIAFDGFVPEMEGGRSGWVVATDFDLPFGDRVFHDPTCLVTDGDMAPATYATGGYTRGDELVPQGEPVVNPDLDLPAF